MEKGGKKTTGFIISDMLCDQNRPGLISVQLEQDDDGKWTITQVERTKKLTLVDLVLSVLPWPFHKDLPTTDPCEGPDHKTNEASDDIERGKRKYTSYPVDRD
ncbi:MAG: hypothetical protein ACE5LB_12595 [Acidiferrobacterales bacterium]